jgi:putative tryptophan/tyrosine transport system substrate-binding protein
MMDRRRFLLTSLAGALAGPFTASAQQTRGLPRIAHLVYGPPECGVMPSDHVFERALSDAGYVVGKNVSWARQCYQKENDLSALVAELVRQSPDVIVTTGTPATLAAKTGTTTIPIVFIGVADPVRSGLVNSLAKPGTNVTGITHQQFDTTEKRLGLLLEAVPGVTHVAALVDPGMGAVSDVLWQEAEKAARNRRVRVSRVDARTGENLEVVFQTIRQVGAQALLVGGSGFFWVERSRMAQLAIKNRLPSMFPGLGHGQAGGLLSYGANDVEIFRSAGRQVARILNGANPRAVPVEQPTKFDLVVNLKTAKALGLTIPPSLLARADQVIE